MGCTRNLWHPHRAERRQNVLTGMNDFRHTLYMHLSQNVDFFIKKPILVDAEMEPLHSFKGDRRAIMSDIGGKIWARGENFDESCNSDFWMVFDDIGPLISHWSKHDIICYSNNNLA